MGFLPVATVHLFPGLRQGLVDLLRGLTGGQWRESTICPGWTVKHVAAHLVGVDLANVAVRRDQHVEPWPPGWGLATFNEHWVESCRRLSPQELTDLADLAGGWFDDYLTTLDLDAIGQAPGWAGGGPAPVWLDVAREYTERWVHQQQIRAAVGVPGFDEERYAGPVIATFMHALPVGLGSVHAPEGTVAVVRVNGVGGGVWHVVRTSENWDLRTGEGSDPVSVVTLDSRTAWQRLSNDRTASSFNIEGDATIGRQIVDAVAILI